MDGYNRGYHSKQSLKVHLIFVTKYANVYLFRKICLTTSSNICMIYPMKKIQNHRKKIERRGKINMPNTSNKIGRFNEPINVGDWCIHDNDLCKVIKLNDTKVTVVRLDEGIYVGYMRAFKSTVFPENIFVLAHDARDMPRNLDAKMEVIEQKIAELNFKNSRKRP